MFRERMVDGRVVVVMGVGVRRSFRRSRGEEGFEGRGPSSAEEEPRRSSEEEEE